jgi:hypothetical protein
VRIPKSLLMMFCLGLFVLSVPLTVRADAWDKATQLTFNQPVEVPGMVLGAGTYTFRLADVDPERNVVQILTADGSRLYENVLAIPAYRLDPTDKTVITFEERAKGTPQAIHIWFYPGSNSGEEFVYPPAEALAAQTPQPQQAAVTPVKPSVPAPATRTKPAELPPVAQTNSVPKTEPAQIAQNTPPPAPAQTPAAATPATPSHPKKLPKTASPFPFLIVLGLLSLGASGSIRVFCKRSV